MVVSIYFISVAYFSMKKGRRYWKWWKELVFREWNNMSGRNGGVLANLQQKWLKILLYKENSGSSKDTTKRRKLICVYTSSFILLLFFFFHPLRQKSSLNGNTQLRLQRYEASQFRGCWTFVEVDQKFFQKFNFSNSLFEDDDAHCESSLGNILRSVRSFMVNLFD